MTVFMMGVFFVLYSFFGWIIDTTTRSYYLQSYAPGSFFPVPLCPIYGFGALGVLFVHPYLKKLPLFFQWVFYSLVLGFFEGLSGFVLFQVFHRRWWHYPEGWFSVGGYTDLPHAMAWGLIAIVLVTHVHPAISTFLFEMNTRVKKSTKALRKAMK